MEISLNTPALLFPAISLLMLAYTNRFLGLAGVIRNLHANYETSSNPKYLSQIENLRKRIRLTRDMQACGVISLLLCTICMFSIYEGHIVVGQILFGASLVAMIASLVISLWEIQMSIGALDHHLKDLEDEITKLGLK